MTNPKDPLANAMLKYLTAVQPTALWPKTYIPTVATPRGRTVGKVWFDEAKTMEQLAELTRMPTAQEKAKRDRDWLRDPYIGSVAYTPWGAGMYYEVGGWALNTFNPTPMAFQPTADMLLATWDMMHMTPMNPEGFGHVKGWIVAARMSGDASDQLAKCAKAMLDKQIERHEAELERVRVRTIQALMYSTPSFARTREEIAKLIGTVL